MSNALPVILIAGAIGLLFIFLGLRANRKKRLLQNLPTCKTTGVFIGLVELKGTAESSTPFDCYLANRRCVYHRWHVSERWSKMVTERYTDSKGKRRTRRRRKSGWRTIAQGGDSQPFYLRDDAGYVLIRPRGSDLEPDTVFSDTSGHPTRSITPRHLVKRLATRTTFAVLPRKPFACTLPSLSSVALVNAAISWHRKLPQTNQPPCFASQPRRKTK